MAKIIYLVPVRKTHGKDEARFVNRDRDNTVSTIYRFKPDQGPALICNTLYAGQSYDLVPPITICGKTMHRVTCAYRIPWRPDEYVVTGIPERETTPFPFVMKYLPEQSRFLSRIITK
ncbi:MAG: hypothetical protein HGA31_01925 [Candidatus Moranbacteria bacterium]|nr:hypothetical protein [Candidatus Moranbacteria bacterium]